MCRSHESYLLGFMFETQRTVSQKHRTGPLLIFGGLNVTKGCAKQEIAKDPLWDAYALHIVLCYV